ncbi:MAG TPA: HSP90 family protein [Gemmataceae bacterium]|nr:HSP90 family protein [Gemmataceae bacterium]
MDYKFQINLRGIIELLSNHLYSGPEVFLRELLQNGVDAIRARLNLEPSHQGEITLEVLGKRGGKQQPTLVFTDNGIGLTEEEIHRFLATIGQSSKNAEFWERPSDFIGQFGIGLLSCFVVSDEIVVITRSMREEHAPTIEWRGKPNGTYTVKVLDRDLAAGTQVYLACKKSCEEHFDPERVAEQAAHFGGLLPYPIRVISGKGSQLINADDPPWRRRGSSEARRAALLEYGRKTFEMDFFDAIPLRSAVGEVEGVAFVLPFSPSLATKRTHRVYLKHMLLSENAEDLVPDWAFFVKCVVNANDLRPTASRDSFYEDDKLAATRAALGQCLRDYLFDLAKNHPERLQQFIALHDLSIKALAVRDDEFYRLFIDWLPFETTLGEMTLGEYRKQNPVLRYVTHLDEFRQIARVAAAQDLCILNGAYIYNAELLEKFSEVFPDEQVEEVDPAGLMQSFEDLALDEREQMFSLIKAADLVLQPFKCAAEIKKFMPAELPALYSTNADAGFLRSVEQSREISNELWSSVLDNLAGKHASEVYAQLCFNYHNPLIRKMAQLRNRTLLQRSIQMLYVQALLLGHHPLNAREMALLNEGLLGLIEWGLNAQERGDA